MTQTPAAAKISRPLPKSWAELTPAEGRYLCALLGSGDYAPAEAAAVYLARREGGAFRPLLRLPESSRPVPAETLAGLSWVGEAPPALAAPPLFAPKGARLLVSPTLRGVPFADYLRLTNLYRAALQSADAPKEVQAAIFRDLAAIVWKAPRRAFGLLSPAAPSPGSRYALLLWLTAWHAFAARRWKHLFTASLSSTAPAHSPEQVMDAEIRALTGGDITKEADILAADTWRALSELDAKAREAAELEKIRKK